MFEQVRTAVDAAREAAAAVDPDALDGPGAVRLLEAGTAIKRAGETLELLAARRLQQTNAGCREGDPTQADYLARKTGTTRREAEATLRTARHLDPLSVTADALRAGELSARQAEAITDACAADPHAERQLVQTATRDGFAALRDECRRVKAAARDDELDHHDRIRRSRYVRAWTDDQGAGRGEWKLTPDAQAKLLARLNAEADLAAEDAKGAGAPIESRERYLADGLERLSRSRNGEPTTPHRRSNPGTAIHRTGPRPMTCSSRCEASSRRGNDRCELGAEFVRYRNAAALAGLDAHVGDRAGAYGPLVDGGRELDVERRVAQPGRGDRHVDVVVEACRAVPLEDSPTEHEVEVLEERRRGSVLEPFEEARARVVEVGEPVGVEHHALLVDLGVPGPDAVDKPISHGVRRRGRGSRRRSPHGVARRPRHR
jgi:hypothetical protein